MSEHQRGLVYLLTGACGFLGQHLLRILLEKEDSLEEIRVFDKRVDPTLHDLKKTKLSSSLRHRIPDKNLNSNL
uniref:3-beta hydroxysteroid dehydrogenase/isomerase domain-containing protein n=1 Tax=Maylandia zebra TaxID=106582 RepID=A0A3P9DA76_9CICH